MNPLPPPPGNSAVTVASAVGAISTESHPYVQQDFGIAVGGGSVADVHAPYRTADGSNFVGKNTLKIPIGVNSSLTSGQVWAWQNPENQSVIVTQVDVNIRVKSSGAGTVDIGSAGTVTSSDNLIDGLSVAGVGLYSNYDNPGTHGKFKQLVAPNAYVTCSVASGDADGLEADFFVSYLLTIPGV